MRQLQTNCDSPCCALTAISVPVVDWRKRWNRSTESGVHRDGIGAVLNIPVVETCKYWLWFLKLFIHQIMVLSENDSSQFYILNLQLKREELGLVDILA